MQSKLPSDKELLEALEKEGEVSLKTDSIQTFLDKFFVVPGDDRVPIQLLYRLYRQTSTEFKSPAGFRNQLDKTFSRKSGYYFYDKKLAKLPEVYERPSFKKDPIKNKRKLAHLESFLKSNPIKPGKDIWVEDYIIHFLYDRWCWNTKKKKSVGKAALKRYMKLHFEFYTRHKITHFHVKQIIYSAMSFDSMQEYRTLHEKKETIRKTKRRKVSSFETRIKLKDKIRIDK